MHGALTVPKPRLAALAEKAKENLAAQGESARARYKARYWREQTEGIQLASINSTSY
jgi:hypothetical protein